VKVLVVHPGPSFSVADVHTGLLKSLRNQPGIDAQEYNLHERLNFYSAAHIRNEEGDYIKAFEPQAAIHMAAKGLEVVLYEWWPDVVIIVSGFFVGPDIWACLARRPHHVVLWCTESPYEDDRQLRQARYADTVIINDPLNLDGYRATVNERTWYFPHSYDPDIHCPGEPEPELECDFGFVGTGFPSRIEFFEDVNWPSQRVKFGGNWVSVPNGSPIVPFLMHGRSECLDNIDAVRLYRSSKVSANLYRQETSEEGRADGWAMGPREVELAACETFFLRNPRPEGDLLFPMLPTFTTPAEFSDLLAWALTHPDETKAAAVAARAAIADRTFDNTAQRLLRVIDTSPPKTPR
jgi:spore maturation protein CgeB